MSAEALGSARSHSTAFLRELHLDRTQVRETRVIAALPALSRVYLRETAIPRAALDALVRARPGLSVFR